MKRSEEKIDVALATCAEFPQLPDDDHYLVKELAGRGVRSKPVVWDAPGFDWSRARLCVLRATWDYSTRHREFLQWIDKVAAATALWNPASVVKWNSHKSYLRDLAEAGIPVAPTVHLLTGSNADLAGLLRSNGWSDAVVKPAVSGTARATIRVSRHTPEEAQRHLDRLLAAEDTLVQEFMESVQIEGEVTVIFLDGRYSHAVRKRPKPGDFRVLEEWGGNTVPDTPSEEALALAEAAMAASPAETLYGRVDLHTGHDGKPLVSELELVEPELYFRHAPEAAGRLAELIGELVGA